MSHIRPGDRVEVRGVEQIQGQVIDVTREGLLVEWQDERGQRVCKMRHGWDEVGAKLSRLPRPQRGRRKS